MTGAGRIFFFVFHFLLKQVIRSCVRAALPMPRGKEHSHLQRWRDAEGNLKEPELALVSCLLTPFFVPSNFLMTLHSTSKLT